MCVAESFDLQQDRREKLESSFHKASLKRGADKSFPFSVCKFHDTSTSDVRVHKEWYKQNIFKDFHCRLLDLKSELLERNGCSVLLGILVDQAKGYSYMLWKLSDSEIADFRENNYGIIHL
jgi:hypothetical protein